MRIENRTARYNYQILDTLEAGIDLLGPEVKSVREGKVSLSEAFIHVRDGQMYLVNAHIHPYPQAREPLDPVRTRRLLLHRKEITSLGSRVAQSGLTLVPLALYNKGNLFKLQIALARGKKAWDKRQAIKKRTEEREVEQSLRGKE